MYSNAIELPIPLKRYRRDVDDGLLGEDLVQVCPVKWEQHKVDVINQELDSLDDVDVFAQVQSCIRSKGRSANKLSENSTRSLVPPFSTVYPRSGCLSPRYCVYLPSKTDQYVAVGEKQPPVEERLVQPLSQRNTINPEIAQDARLETTVLQQISQLRQQGVWSAGRLPKVMEPVPDYTWNDCFLEEVTWMAVDFCEERKWKMQMARNLAEAARNYLVLRQEWNRQCQLVEEVCRKRNAAYVATIIRDWWSRVNQGLEFLGESARRRHFSQLLKQNKLALTACSDLGPSWVARVPYEVSPLSEWQQVINSNFQTSALRSDGDSHDSDWLPGPHSDESDYDEPHSRSTSSSRAASFIDDSDTNAFGISEFPHIPFMKQKYEEFTTGCTSRMNEPTVQSNDPLSDPVTQVHSEIKPQESDVGVTPLVDRSELEALISEAEAPLCQLLPTPSQQPGMFEAVADRTFAQSDVNLSHKTTSEGCSFADTESDNENSEVIMLKADAERSLEDLLPPEFLDSSDDRLIGDQNGTSQHSMMESCSESPSYSTDSREGCFPRAICGDVPMKDQSDQESTSPDEEPCFQEDSTVELADPPLDDIKLTSTHLTTLNELRWAAIQLYPLLKPPTAETCASSSALLTTAYSPAFRVRSLPSTGIGSIVTWLRHAISLGIPGLLLSQSAISGDAELAVSAHLGQLPVPGTRASNTLCPESFPKVDSVDETGDWGPHLIVAPRLCIPAWRTRLSTWCPGLRITCLGVGSRGTNSDSEPSGTGRRLRFSVARGAVNVCITSYAAIVARPSRYSRIRWRVVVFDQVHHLFSCRSPPSQSKESTPNKTAQVHSRTSSGALDILISELRSSGHRILISSATDLLSSACGFRLFELSRLLLSQCATDNEAYQLWTAELFSAVEEATRNSTHQPMKRERPSKKQMIKFLEPFVLRLDEEYESSDEKIVHCPMTTVQRKVHDTILSSKVARSASKTGGLLDLLHTVTRASRICNHPCLLHTHPYGSSTFLNTLASLYSHRQPKPGPFVFDGMFHTNTSTNSGGLLYSTPSAVLQAVRQLRDSELSEITLQGFQLSRVLEDPVQIRERIAVLAPTRQQLELTLIPKSAKENTQPKLPQPPPPVARDLPNGGFHYGFGSDRSHFGVNGQDIPSKIGLKANVPLTNGLPELPTVHLDFSSIPVRSKRPRISEKFPLGSPVKRGRFDDSSISPSSPTIGSNKVATTGRTVERVVCKTPFLGSEMLNSLEREVPQKKSTDSRNPRITDDTSSLGRSVPHLSALNRLTNGSIDKVQPSISQHPPNIRPVGFDSSIRLDGLLRDNNRRCTQLTGFADWCSLATYNSLHLNRTYLGQPMLVQSPEALCFPQLTDLVESLEPLLLYISRISHLGLLCSRPRVIALPPRLLTLKSGYVSSVDQPPYTSDLYSTSLFPVQSLYPFTEPARWLSPNSPSRFPLNRSHATASAFNQSESTPLGRLFSESGKFFSLHCLLSELLGAKSQPRPRCVYLLAHRSAFLDLLEAYLAISPWRMCYRLRLPGGFDSVDAHSDLLIGQINSWPRGTRGPLLVLIHSRSPATCLTGLKAGPDTVVIICDVDLRADSVDKLRALTHSWTLNGLVDQPNQEDKTDGLSPSAQVYRLVSVDLPNRSGLCPSVEACLSREFACRLLPEAVFQAHSSAPSDCHSLLIARVQPNVVNAFLSNRVPYEPDPIVFGSSYRGFEPEHGSLLAIKQEAPPYSSASSGASSSSYPFFDCMRGDAKSRETGDEFQEREPLCEHLLNRALELFEDPVDTQVWCCAYAEQTSISRTIFHEPTTDNHRCPQSDDSDDDLCVSHPKPRDVFLLEPSLETGCHNVPCDLAGELGYSDNTSWEVAHQEACDYISQLYVLVDQPTEACFCYHAFAAHPLHASNQISEEMLIEDTEIFSPADSPLSFTAVDLWEPFTWFQSNEASKPKSDAATSSAIFHLGDEEYSPLINVPAQSIVSEDRIPGLPPPRSRTMDASHWGYECEALSEHELPPITQIPATSVASTHTTATCHIPGLKRSDPPDSDSESGKSLRYSSSSSFATSNSYTSPYLKRRRLAGSAVYRKHFSTPLPATTPTSDDSVEQSVCTATDTDSSLLPPPSPSKTAVRETISVTRPSSAQQTVSPQYVATGTSSAGASGLSSGGFTLSLNPPSGSGSSNYPKLHIPRANYNKDFATSRSGRHRRSTTVSTSGTANASGVASAAAVVALATGPHLPQSPVSKAPAYQVPAPPSGNQSPFSNPAVLARYGHTSPGRYGPSTATSQANLPASIRYGSSGTATSAGLNTTAASVTNITGSHASGTQATGHLHVGKPLEWHVNEEAALYQSIVKLQEMQFDSTGGVSPNSSLSPNFRLAEFFINNFFPTRGYRGARQCLLMHARMLTVVSTAITALSSNVGTSGLPEDAANSTPVSTSTSINHGPSSRKVKNKLKSSAAVAAAAAANLGLSPQPSGLGSQANDPNSDNLTVVNRYRTYLSYQHLRLVHPDGTSTTTSLASDVPPQLTQLLNTIKTDDETQSKILRKAIKDSLVPPPVIPPGQHHRPSGSRRQQATGFSGSPGAASPGPAFHSGGTGLSGSPGPSGSIYNYPASSSHSTSSSSFFPASVGHGSHPTTGPSPALLTHHRHHHRHTPYDYPPGSQASSTPATDSSVSSQPTTFTSTTSSTHSGPMIQKNPTHIAALQEHNINPDTLITPAMVIKNKEEREARLLAESISSSAQPPHSSSSPSTGLSATTAVSNLPATLQPSTSFSSHQTPLTFHSHSQDTTAHPSVLLSLPLETTSTGSGTCVTSSLSLNLTGTPLSFSHPSQRGTSFVTIVSSNPTMLRRSATFTSVNVSNQFTDTLSTRVPPFQSNQPPSTVVGLNSATISTQLGKASVPSGYFLQRPQFLSSNTPISPSSTRGIFTTLAGVSATPNLPLGGGFGSGLAPVPQILRPRNTLRGSVIQPTFVRTLSATSASSFPISQMGARLASSNTNFLHGRVTLAVPSSPSVSSVLASRPNPSVGIRHQAPTIFQQVRPGAQSQLGSFSYGYQLAGNEPRSFTSQLQGAMQPISPGIPASVNVTTTSSGVSIFESASSRQSEADPFVQSRFRPQPTP